MKSHSLARLSYCTQQGIEKQVVTTIENQGGRQSCSARGLLLERELRGCNGELKDCGTFFAVGCDHVARGGAKGNALRRHYERAELKVRGPFIWPRPCFG